MTGWVNEKPTKPGRYIILRKEKPPSAVRWEIEVDVKKYGRGLRVIPQGPWPPVPMSDIGAKDFWWKERLG